MNVIRIAKWGAWRKVWADDMLLILGVKRLPDEGMPERVIQGVRVYVKPKPIQVVPRGYRRRHMVALRVMAICECGQHLAVGRIHQHVCKGGK